MKENKSVSQSQALNPFEWVHQLVRASNHCQLSSVQDGYPCAQKIPYALHPVSQKFPQCRLWNGSNVCLIDDGPLSSFQGKSSSASSFHLSLLQVISGVMSLVLCLQVVSQASQHFRSSEKQATCEGCFAH